MLLACFPHPRPPAQGPVALHPDRGLGGECNLPGSCPSPPAPCCCLHPSPRSAQDTGPLPASLGCPGLPPPSPCASHAVLPAQGLGAPSFCPGGSMASPRPPPLRPLPPSQWVTGPHQPFCSQSAGPSDSRAARPRSPPDPSFVFSAVPAVPERRLHVIPAPSMSVK